MISGKHFDFRKQNKETKCYLKSNKNNLTKMDGQQFIRANAAYDVINYLDSLGSPNPIKIQLMTSLTTWIV